MGQVLQSLERLKEAEEHYLKAVALRPNYWRHYSLLGAFYYATGRSREAVAAFTRVTELQPDNARGFNNLGAAYYALGDNVNALKFYERAVAITPMPEALSNIGNIHFVEGRYEQALASFQQAVTALPNDGLLRGNLGDALARLNRTEGGAAGVARGGAARPPGPGREPERRDNARAYRAQGSQARRPDRGRGRHHARAVAQCQRLGSALSFRRRSRTDR